MGVALVQELDPGELPLELLDPFAEDLESKRLWDLGLEVQVVSLEVILEVVEHQAVHCLDGNLSLRRGKKGLEFGKTRFVHPIVQIGHVGNQRAVEGGEQDSVV